jgi:hypothetical protein
MLQKGHADVAEVRKAAVAAGMAEVDGDEADAETDEEPTPAEPEPEPTTDAEAEGEKGETEAEAAPEPTPTPEAPKAEVKWPRQKKVLQDLAAKNKVPVTKSMNMATIIKALEAAGVKPPKS